MNYTKAYLDNWQHRVLVDKELWNFVSGETNYHKKVLQYIDETSSILLHKDSIEKEIENAITRIISEFESKYGKGKTGVVNFIEKIL